MHSIGKTKTTCYSSCRDLPTLRLSFVWLLAAKFHPSSSVLYCLTLSMIFLLSLMSALSCTQEEKPFHKGPWQGGELIAESYHQCTYCKRKSFGFFKVFFDNSVSNRTEFLDWIWPGKNKQTTDLVLLKLHRVRPYLSSEHVHTKIVALVLAGITKM